MDSVLYEKLRRDRPDLKLPAWRDLLPTDKHRARRQTVRELVGRRSAKLLARDPGTVDRGLGSHFPSGFKNRRLRWRGDATF